MFSIWYFNEVGSIGYDIFNFLHCLWNFSITEEFVFFWNYYSTVENVAFSTTCFCHLLNAQISQILFPPFQQATIELIFCKAFIFVWKQLFVKKNRTGIEHVWLKKSQFFFRTHLSTDFASGLRRRFVFIEQFANRSWHANDAGDRGQWNKHSILRSKCSVYFPSVCKTRSGFKQTEHSRYGLDQHHDQYYYHL